MLSLYGGGRFTRRVSLEAAYSKHNWRTVIKLMPTNDALCMFSELAVVMTWIAIRLDRTLGRRMSQPSVGPQLLWIFQTGIVGTPVSLSILLHGGVWSSC